MQCAGRGSEGEARYSDAAPSEFRFDLPERLARQIGHYVGGRARAESYQEVDVRARHIGRSGSRNLLNDGFRGPAREIGARYLTYLHPAAKQLDPRSAKAPIFERRNGGDLRAETQDNVCVLSHLHASSRRRALPDDGIQRRLIVDAVFDLHSDAAPLQCLLRFDRFLAGDIGYRDLAALDSEPHCHQSTQERHGREDEDHPSEAEEPFEVLAQSHGLRTLISRSRVRLGSALSWAIYSRSARCAALFFQRVSSLQLLHYFGNDLAGQILVASIGAARSGLYMRTLLSTTSVATTEGKFQGCVCGNTCGLQPLADEAAMECSGYLSTCEKISRQE